MRVVTFAAALAKARQRKGNKEKDQKNSIHNSKFGHSRCEMSQSVAAMKVFSFDPPVRSVPLKDLPFLGEIGNTTERKTEIWLG